MLEEIKHWREKALELTEELKEKNDIIYRNNREEKTKESTFVKPIKEMENMKIELPTTKQLSLKHQQSNNLKEKIHILELENENIKTKESKSCCPNEQNKAGLKQCCQTNDQMKDMKLNISQKDCQIVQLRLRIKSVNRHKELWEKKLARRSKLIASVNKTNNKLKGEIEYQKIISEKKQKDSCRKDVDLENLEKNATSQHMEITTLKSLLKLEQNELENLEIKYKHQSANLVAKKNEIDELRYKIELDQSNIQSFQNNIQMFQEKLNEQNIEMSNYAKMNIILIKDIASMKNDHHKETSRHVQDLEIMKKEFSCQQEEMKSLKSEIEVKDKKLENLKTHNKNQEIENDSLKKTLNITKENNTNLMAQLEAKVLEKDLKMTEMTRQLETLELDFHKSQDEFKSLNLNSKTLEAKNHQKDTELALNNQIKIVQEQEIESLKQNLAKSNLVNKTNQAQNNNIANLKQKLQESQKEIEHLKSIYQKNQQQNKTIYILKLKLRELQIENELLRRNINRSDQTNIDQSKIIQSLKQQEEERISDMIN